MPSHRSRIRYRQAEVRTRASRRVRVWLLSTRCRRSTARQRRLFSASPDRVARRPSEGSARATSPQYGCADAPRLYAALSDQTTRSPERRLQCNIDIPLTESVLF